jgi:hypothetical protein
MDSEEKKGAGSSNIFLATLLFPAATFIIALLLVLAGCGDQKSAGSSECTTCHNDATPGIVGQWEDSKHSSSDVGCLDCHKANQGEPDAFDHNGYTIATIVSPTDCAGCHEQQEKQFTASHHANAAKFIGSLDNILGVAVEGAPAAISGCQQCHGSTVKVTTNGTIDATTWPNTGIGRINPDGSKGACSACHSRHEFSAAQARQPENCGKCHMGPDHPQIEIYNESKHGVLFRANIDQMNLDSPTWVVGQDYTAAPTCATCHMSATPDQPTTHDVGARISWTLRPVISTKQPEWASKRAAMKGVCVNCHSGAYVDKFYSQFDDAVGLYNNKFATPAKTLMDEFYAEGLLTKQPFDEKIEWTYYELWHHEGRRARHGASMSGPDYTQWHGFYEVAKHFYNDFLPEAEQLKPGVTDRILADEYHKWKKGLSPQEMEGLLQFYQERYGQ